MRILITGIHGFVGSNLVEALSGEHTIYGLDIVSLAKKGISYTFSWDDLDKGIVPAVDAIIHLAGKAHDTKNQTQAEVYFRVNRDLTIRIFDYFSNHPEIKKFIFFSTTKAVADRVNGVLTEEVIPNPVGPYGESKFAAENYILNSIRNRPDSFFRKGIFIFRPCMIHGPGNKGNLNLLYNVVKKGIPWPLGAFDNKRTFTSVDNVCYVVNEVLTKEIPSGVYNLGDDEPISTNQLIEEICESLGRKAKIWRVPVRVMTVVAIIGGWLHLPLDPERLRKLTENYVSSNSKIKKALGVDFMPINAEDGLKHTLESFKKNTTSYIGPVL